MPVVKVIFISMLSILTILLLVITVPSDIVYAEIIGVLLILKVKVFAFAVASKLKVIGFLKGLTVIQVLVLGMKRYILDNVLSKWLEKNVISHLRPVFVSRWHYFKHIPWKTRAKQSLYFVFPATIAFWVLWVGDMLSSIAFAAQLKIIVIGFFKFLWVVAYKVFESFMFVFSNYIMGTWIASVLEVLALSYIITLLEKIPFIGKYISKGLKWVYDLFEKLTNLIKKVFGGLNNNRFSGRFSNYVEKFSAKMYRNMNPKKIEVELQIVEKIQSQCMYSYFNLKARQRPEDKMHMYQMVNKNTNDGFDVVAYIEFEHNDIITAVGDLIIFEGLASHSALGATDGEFHSYGFWVLNLASIEHTVKCTSGNFKDTTIPPKDIKYVDAWNPVSYLDKSIYVEDHENEIVSIKPVLTFKAKRL